MLAVPPDQPGALADVGGITADRFLHLLTESRLMTVEEVRASLTRIPSAYSRDARKLAQEMVRLQKLTHFQASQIYQGKPKGLVLGNYVILEKVGAGGMGLVFKARHRRLQRVVALKVLPSEITHSAHVVRRFQREARAAARLNHPNIVAALDADEDQGIHFLVMEYVEGNDLSRLVKQNGPLTVPLAVNAILQVARGLEHAHASGIIHRDIKPANLLMASDRKTPHVKILDMGLARIESACGANGNGSDDLTKSGSILGTSDYMSPEQALNTKNADHRSDIYSLGCTFFYLLTGKVMFPGETQMEKLLAHREVAVPSLRKTRSDVPMQLETIFQRMVAKKPGDRYQSTHQLVCDLSRVSNVPGRRIRLLLPAIRDFVSVSYTEIQSTAYKYRRRFWLVGVAIVAMAALGLIGFHFLFTRAPSPSTGTDSDWRTYVTSLPVGKRISEVKRKMKQVNPSFNGEWSIQVEEGFVTQLSLNTNQVKDISALKAFSKLQRLTCNGSKDKGQLTDLAPLNGMDLVSLTCGLNPRLEDLSPLSGMKLRTLEVYNTSVEDLSPLKGMPLGYLNCSGSRVKDLSPLRGMNLHHLYCGGTRITNLQPILGMPLTTLAIQENDISDLKPIIQSPLQELHGKIVPRDKAILDLIPTLQRINRIPVAEYWGMHTR